MRTGATAGGAFGDTFVGIENLTGSRFSDNLVGDGGNNVLKGLAGNDTLIGDDGADTLNGGAGNDGLSGGAGLDTASWAGSAVGVSVDLPGGIAFEGGGVTRDTLTGIENLVGSGHNDGLTGSNLTTRIDGGGGADVIFAGTGNAALLGGSGDDTIVADRGIDKIDGGAGVDTVDYRNSQTGVNVNLATSVNGGDHASGDTFAGVENASGSFFSDQLVGTAGANRLAGLDGDDKLFGDLGSDTLLGGFGADRLVGGQGADRFVFTRDDESDPGSGHRDVITDFSHAQGDRIDVSGVDAVAATIGDEAFAFLGNGQTERRRRRCFFEGDHTVVGLNTVNDGSFTNSRRRWRSRSRPHRPDGPAISCCDPGAEATGTRDGRTNIN